MALTQVKRSFINFCRRVVAAVFVEAQRQGATQRASYLEALRSRIAEQTPENIVRFGYSVYSQNEEDGIINRINSVLGIVEPTFIEFGVGVTENNTLNLLLSQGKGVWIDKQLEDFKKRCPDNSRLLVLAEFITLKNILTICDRARQFLRLKALSELDLLCLDLDGNDYYLVEAMLRHGCNPKIFCLEYNAKFPPPQNVRIRYDDAQVWRNNDDYFGCSLQAYVDLLGNFGYVLVTCNLSGSNCFFVRKEFAARFVLYEPAALHQPPRPFLSPFEKGTLSSEKFLLQTLSGSACGVP